MQRSKPIVANIGARLHEVRALPKTPIAAAVRYFENQWTALKTFLDHPKVPLQQRAIDVIRGG